MRWLAITGLAVGLGLAGCPKRSDPGLQVDELVRQADVQWSVRGRVGFDAAGRPLVVAYGLDSGDPDVLWRIARWRIAEGVAADDPAVAKASLAEARAVAAQCLERDPAYATRRAAGWDVALAALSDERRGCVAWTALAWARWAELHGAEAAALDLPAIDALVLAAAGGDARTRAVADWAAGLSLATRPAWAGRDLEAAGRRLRAVIAADPDAVTPRVDLIRLVARPSADPELERLVADTLALPARGPEEAAAQARLRALAP